MTENNSINDFNREAHCTYKEEQYSARDNGAILKYPRIDKKARLTDNQWTFGKTNEKTGYLEIASQRIHRIVATAFHGMSPTKEHVVDHIDTNKQNNRPENLRWVTRLENVLLNPITAKRIRLVCGSVEAFLANPSKFRDKFPEPNYSWMTNVSTEEAQTSLDRLLGWANSDKISSKGSLAAWILERSTWQAKYSESAPNVSELITSMTTNAVQRYWATPSEFPCCPKEITEPINDYASQLIKGLVFCRNDVYSSLVLETVISEDRNSIYIIAESSDSKNAIKPWAVAKITYENDLFVHESLGNFFTQVGAEKEYCLAQGLEWFGGESIDDYC